MVQGVQPAGVHAALFHLPGMWLLAERTRLGRCGSGQDKNEAI
jgi:hypothetical protein